MSTESLEKAKKDSEYYREVQKSRTVNNAGYYIISAKKSALLFSKIIEQSVFHDDLIVDFGGSEGYASMIIRDTIYIKPVVYDINPEALDKASNLGFITKEGDLENIDIYVDNHVDWSFCSHALEHVLNLDKAISELSRVTRRGIFLVFPLETKESFECNPEHMRHSEDPDTYLKPFRDLGWKIGYIRYPDKERPEDVEAWLYR